MDPSCERARARPAESSRQQDLGAFMPYPPRGDSKDQPDSSDSALAHQLLRNLWVRPLSTPWTARALTSMANASSVSINAAGKLQHRDPDGQPLGWAVGMPRRVGRPLGLTATGDDEVAVLCHRRWSRQAGLMLWKLGSDWPVGALSVPWQATVVVSLGGSRVALAAPSAAQADRISIVDLAQGRIVKPRLRIGRYSHHPALGPWRPDNATNSLSGPPRLTSLTRAGGSLLGITEQGCVSVWRLEPPFSLRLTVASPGGRVQRCLRSLDDGNTLFAIERPEGERLQIMDWAHMKFLGLPGPATFSHTHQSLYLALLSYSQSCSKGHRIPVLGDGDLGADTRADVLLELHHQSIGTRDLTLMSACVGGRFLCSRSTDGQDTKLLQVMQLGL